jgi:hypothetical protein
MIGFSSLSIPIIGLSPFIAGHMVIQCGDQLPPNGRDELQAYGVSITKGLFISGLRYFLVYRALALATAGQLHPFII